MEIHDTQCKFGFTIYNIKNLICLLIQSLKPKTYAWKMLNNLYSLEMNSVDNGCIDCAERIHYGKV